MGKFKQNKKFNKRDNSGGGGFGGRDQGRPSMHSTVCSECGRDCEVPFKPTGDKPVFCNECFRNKGASQPRRFDRRDSGTRGMHQAICDKCGKACEVPFRPTGDKPIYCNECFGRGGGGRGKPSGGQGQPSSQLEKINAKLDQILKALSPANSVGAAEKKKPAQKHAVKTKPVKPKKESKSKPKKPSAPKKAKAKTKAKPKPKPKPKKKK